MAMIYTIKNDNLTVEINSLGAQLWSIKDKVGKEYLWQGDPEFWKDRAINLFPYIARLTEGKYKYQDKTYELPIHGFVRGTELEVEQSNDAEIKFVLTDNEETYQQYPFHFCFQVRYQLLERKFKIEFYIENCDEKPIYLGVGGHPGFQVPIQKELDFEDYYLEFSAVSSPKRVEFSQDCFVLDENKEYEMINGTRIPLAHTLFDEDAIVLKNTAKEVVIKSDKDPSGIRVSFPSMEYIGFWHKPCTKAPYVCIEPWSSLPSRKGIIEHLEEQDNLIMVKEKEDKTFDWTIEIF